MPTDAAASSTPPSTAGRFSTLRAVAFDIIETVFPLEPLRDDLIAWGLPPGSLETWFATALRDAFALAAADDFAPFPRVLKGALQQVLAQCGVQVPEDRQSGLLQRLRTLPCRPDAAQAFGLLRARGVPVIALSNGSAETTRAMLEASGLARWVDHVVSVDAVRLSKPRAEVYRHAASVAGVAPAELALAAVHPWDINGAAAAGLITGYVSLGRAFSDVMRPPDVTGDALLDVADALSRLAQRP